MLLTAALVSALDVRWLVYGLSSGYLGWEASV